MSTAEATGWLRELLEPSVGADRAALLTVHGLKATLLSWAAKSTLFTADEQLALGHHVSAQYRSAMIYSRDNQIGLCKKVHTMFSRIRDGSFDPDAARVNRLFQLAFETALEEQDDEGDRSSDSSSDASSIASSDGEHSSLVQRTSYRRLEATEIDEEICLINNNSKVIHMMAGEDEKFFCGRSPSGSCSRAQKEDSICQSQCHLRARCPQRNDGSQPAGAPASSVGQIHHTSQASRSMYVHFAAFQAQAGSEQSWSRVDTPREEGDEQGGRRREQEGVPTPQAANATAEERPEVYQMTPDPLEESDPWQAWMNADQAQGSGGPSHSTYVPMPSQSGVTVPAWHVPDVRSFLEVSGLATTRPQVGDGREQLLLPPLPPSYATTTQALQSIVESTMGGGSAAAEAIGMFTQVHARRQERRRDHHRDQHQKPEQSQQPEPRETRPRGDGGLEVYQDTCTICLNRFVAEDHCCRMQCRHVLHCACIGEYLQHTAPVNETDIRMNCPNCREETQVDRSWIQPTFNLQQPQTVEEQLEEAVRTPLPSEGREVSAEEYVTPDAPRAYPWWPETNPPTPAESGETSPGYLTTVRGEDGQLGLLVDPGSYGNLAGSGWVEGVASAREQRAAPLRVGGVGRGSQNCREDVRIPLAIPRSDGSVKGGTYTAPVIEGSNAPALLGLKSLTQHRAVLDLVSNQLHLLGPGESRFELTEGTETFSCHSKSLHDSLR